MQFHESAGIRHLTFDIFPENVLHSVFTRQGGLSPEPGNSLNVGGGVGDERERVRSNRFRAFDLLGRNRNSIFDVWQVHSADIVLVNAPHPRLDKPPEFKADGMVTQSQDVTLFMRFADCTPILLHDPVTKSVGIVHSGWQGTMKKCAAAAVKTMQAAFGAHPEDILAAIGPAIGPDHYEVGANVIEQASYAFGPSLPKVLHVRDGRSYFDLWAANTLVLEQAGVKQVEVAELCTACHTKDWYSHRAEKGKTGRFGAMIALR
jgi:polyphenol oxidase